MQVFIIMIMLTELTVWQLSLAVSLFQTTVQSTARSHLYHGHKSSSGAERKKEPVNPEQGKK